jgi:hypothetical protein
VDTPVASPLVMTHTEESPQSAWVVQPFPRLPFNGWVRTVESVVPNGPIRDDTGGIYYGAPYYRAQQGPNKDWARLYWEKPVAGAVTMRLRIDNPV